MDLLKEMGALAFASRLKRLSDRLMEDVRTLYRRVDIDFNPRWFTTLYTLNKCGPLSITDLAQMIGLTHTAVHQLAQELEKEGLTESSGSTRDRRKRMLSLTPAGDELAVGLIPVWDAIEAATEALIKESGSNILQGISVLEASLDEEDMFRRAWFRLKQRPSLDIAIEPYRPAYKKHFETLNRQWLEHYFEIEEHDARMLEDPRTSILKKGGIIIFALVDGEVVGTCALLRHDDYRELSKMAVTPGMRGLGVGSRLLQAVFDHAASEEVPEIYLQTSSTLEAAVRLYKRHGFRVIETLPFAPPRYCRESICMVCPVDGFIP